MVRKTFSPSLNLSSAIIILAVVIFCVSSAAAQDLGGSLGGSAGVFRPNNPASNSFYRKALARKAKLRFASKNRQALTAVNRSRRAPRRLPAKNIDFAAVEAAIAAGNDARDERSFVAAQLSYERAQQLNPKDSRGFYGLGNVFTDQQRWEEAAAAYQQSLAVDPQQAEANVALSYVLLQQNRRGNIAKRFAEAENAARRAIEIDASNPMAHDQLGVALEMRGLINEETENAYRRAIQTDKYFAPAYAHLARLLRKKGNAEEAAVNNKKAVSLADNVPTIILVAEVLQNEEHFADAEKLLRRAMRLDDGNPMVLFLLGQNLLRQNNPAAAEIILSKAVRINPYSFLAHNLLGTAYLQQSKYEDAERVYTQALPLAAAEERRQLAGKYGFTGVGDGYLKSGQKISALRVYQQALTLDADNTELIAKITAAKNDNQ